MLKQIQGKYYSKITLICVATVFIITGSMLSIASSFVRSQERNEYLKNYDIALNTLSNALAGRVNVFADAFAPLFTNPESYDALCKFYLNPMEESATTSNEVILQLLSTLSNTDQNCRGVLLLTRSGRLFQYDKRYASLVPLPLRETTFQFTPYKNQILTDTQIESLSPDIDKTASHVYGLSGTIFAYQEEEISNLGYIVLLYSTDEFSSILSDIRLDDSCVFTMSDPEQNIIYSSDGSYEILPEVLLQSSFASQAMFHPRYQFITSYHIPQSILKTSKTQYALMVLGVSVCLFSVLLYSVAFRMSDKKITAIQNGMSQVSQNNLSYRMPIPNSNDEFTKIITSFNNMCDELQHNVEKAYLYEISQRKAELYAMQTSINPHFLYNSLEQIRILIMSNQPSDAAGMLLTLSKIYRSQTKRDLYITIGEECSYMENLLQFYMYRYDNFEYEMNIDPSIKKYGIPKNTLQPLLENYFIHGLIPDWEDNQLFFSITPIIIEDVHYLEFVVEDNGHSISLEDLALLKEKLIQPIMSRNEENGFALSNVNTRLILVYGDRSGLHPQALTHPKGFRISFQIPPILPEDLEKDFHLADEQTPSPDHNYS